MINILLKDFRVHGQLNGVASQALYSNCNLFSSLCTALSFLPEKQVDLDDDVITHVLVENKVDFLKMFISRGVIMKEYLTVIRLIELYNNEMVS